MVSGKMILRCRLSPLNAPAFGDTIPAWIDAGITFIGSAFIVTPYLS
jgi:hypothetical protein